MIFKGSDAHGCSTFRVFVPPTPSFYAQRQAPFSVKFEPEPGFAKQTSADRTDHSLPREAIYFPPGTSANILRGAFGSIFRRIACVPQCELRATCFFFPACRLTYYVIQ
jgi:hypothetical protein